MRNDSSALPPHRPAYTVCLSHMFPYINDLNTHSPPQVHAETQNLRQNSGEITADNF